MTFGSAKDWTFSGRTATKHIAFGTIDGFGQITFDYGAAIRVFLVVGERPAASCTTN